MASLHLMAEDEVKTISAAAHEAEQQNAMRLPWAVAIASRMDLASALGCATPKEFNVQLGQVVFDVIKRRVG